MKDLNFEYIELIADYIDGKIISKEDKERLLNKFEEDKIFREMYTTAYEYLKNLEHKGLKKVPEELKKEAFYKKKAFRKLVVEIKNKTAKLISNTIDKLKVKEHAIEFLSSEENNIVSQQFVLNKSLIELKANESGKGCLKIKDAVGQHLILKELLRNYIIIDLDEVKKDEMIFDNLDDGLYELSLDNDKINIEIIS